MRSAHAIFTSGIDNDTVPTPLRPYAARYIRLQRARERALVHAARRAGVRYATRVMRQHIANKLAVVVGYSELLADDEGLPLPVRRQASRMLASAMAAADIIRTLEAEASL